MWAVNSLLSARSWKRLGHLAALLSGPRLSVNLPFHEDLLAPCLAALPIKSNSCCSCLILTQEAGSVMLHVLIVIVDTADSCAITK